MKKFKLRTEDRKVLVNKISELTGEKLKYTQTTEQEQTLTALRF